MAETGADNKSETTVTQVNGATEEKMNVSLEEARQAAAAADTNVDTPEKLGVTAEQFDKYYDKEKKSYNWQAHAKEAEFKAQQRQEKPAEGETRKAEDLSNEDAAEIANKAGLNMSDLQAKIVEKGDIDEADYKALEAVGIPRDIAEDYIDVSKERAVKHIDAVLSEFGGESVFEKVAKHAQDTLSEDDLQSFNKRLSDPKSYKSAVAELLKLTGLPPASKGQPILPPNNNGGGSPSVQPFANQMEMVQAQRDPRYRTDPAYRKQVEDRARASTWGMNPRAHTSGL